MKENWFTFKNQTNSGRDMEAIRNWNAQRYSTRQSRVISINKIPDIIPLNIPFLDYYFTEHSSIRRNPFEIRFALGSGDSLTIIIFIILPHLENRAKIRRKIRVRKDKSSLWNDKESKKRLELTGKAFQTLVQQLPWDPIDLLQHSRIILFEPLWNYAIRKAGTDDLFEMPFLERISHITRYNACELTLHHIIPTIASSEQHSFHRVKIKLKNIVDHSILPSYSTILI